MPPILNMFRFLRPRSMSQGTKAMPNDALPIGTPVGNEHCITGYLGSGGFGHTYLAQAVDGRTVALKECFPFEFCRRNGLNVGVKTHDQEESFYAILVGFLDEAQMLTEFNHPNIVGGGKVVQAHGTIYIEMDCIRGMLLSHRINRWFGKLPIKKSRAIAHDLLSALQHMHSKGYLHKDISPDNIILLPDGRAMLIDLGSVQHMDAPIDEDPMLVVKAGYSPQEFYRAGSVVGQGSDLYQLGATLRHCITGERPIESVKRLHARAQGKSDPLPALSNKNAPGSDFKATLDQAMAVLLNDRIESAAQWQTRLVDT